MMRVPVDNCDECLHFVQGRRDNWLRAFVASVGRRHCGAMASTVRRRLIERRLDGGRTKPDRPHRMTRGGPIPGIRRDDARRRYPPGHQTHCRQQTALQRLLVHALQCTKTESFRPPELMCIIVTIVFCGIAGCHGGIQSRRFGMSSDSSMRSASIMGNAAACREPGAPGA